MDSKVRMTITEELGTSLGDGVVGDLWGDSVAESPLGAGGATARGMGVPLGDGVAGVPLGAEEATAWSVGVPLGKRVPLGAGGATTGAVGVSLGDGVAGFHLGGGVAEDSLEDGVAVTLLGEEGAERVGASLGDRGVGECFLASDSLGTSKEILASGINEASTGETEDKRLPAGISGTADALLGARVKVVEVAEPFLLGGL